MEKIEVMGRYRDKTGKGIARQLRRQGEIPAVIYNKGNSKPLTLDPKSVQAVRHSIAGENALINLQIRDENGKVTGSHLAILRDFQTDPLTEEILHADLFEISMKDQIDVNVAVEIIGSVPIGVKQDNGVLRHNLRELAVRCLPSDIPDNIQIDASNLGIGETIHVSDIPLPKGVKTLDQGSLAVVSITASISEEKLEELLSTTPEEVKTPEVTEQKQVEEAEAPEKTEEPKKS